MNRLFLSIFLSLSSLAYSQGNIFKENKVFKYLASYKTSQFETHDTITFIVTGKMWKFAPKTSKEMIIKYDLKSIDSSLFSDLQHIGWIEHDTTGVIENDKECWIHPPRHNQFMILELASFPRVKFPLETGMKFSNILFIGEGWGDISNSRVYNDYEVIKHIDNEWHILAEARPTAFPDETNRHEYIFDEKEGFIRMAYSFHNGTSIILERIE